MHRSSWLQEFIGVYTKLGTDNLNTLEKIYHPDVTFIDPLHQVRGFEELLQSFRGSYANIIECTFVIEHAFESGNEAAVYWNMAFRHKSLNGKELILVQGHSHLKAENGQVIFHRDYLDIGEMLYEHVPVLGGVVQTIKKRAGG